MRYAHIDETCNSCNWNCKSTKSQNKNKKFPWIANLRKIKKANIKKIMSRDLVCFVFLLQDCIGVKNYLGLGSSHFLETGLRILQVTFLTGSDLWEEEEKQNLQFYVFAKQYFFIFALVKRFKAFYVNIFESLNVFSFK